MPTRQPLTARASGFTLIELLIVITIIAVLSTLILYGANVIRMQARVMSTAKRMDQIILGLQCYSADRNSSAAAVQQQVLRSVPRLAPLSAVLMELNNSSHWTGALATAKMPPNTQINAGTDLREDSRYKLLPLLKPAFSTWAGVGTPGKSFRESTIGGESLVSTLEVYPFGTPPYTSAVPQTRPDTSWYRTTAWPTVWPASNWAASTPGTIPVVWGTPWGKGDWMTKNTADGINGLFYDATCAGYVARSVVTWLDGTLNPSPPSRNLGQLSPLQTVVLLQAAGILAEDASGPTDYRGNRSTDKAWNDAWGNPLILAVASFYPPRHDSRGSNVPDWSLDIPFMRPRDFLIARARENFGYSASVYLSVGSMGPIVAADTLTAAAATTTLTWASGVDNLVLQQAWVDITTVCAATDWTDTSFSKPPWTGLRKKTTRDAATGRVRTCLLQAPTEIK